MTSNPFLSNQLRLLIAQFGRKSVLEALASASEITSEQIEEVIRRMEASRHSRRPKSTKTMEELVEDIQNVPESTKGLLRQLGHRFESKAFLPNLRDAEEFLRRRGLKARKYKSRKEVGGPILRALCEMSESELASLLSHCVGPGDQSDYSLLSRELMGKHS